MTRLPLSLRSVAATAPTITTAPTIVGAPGRSPRNAAPSATATSGLTYWWVTTREIDRRVLEEPRVGGEPHDRAERHQVDPRGDGAWPRGPTQVEVAPLAERGADDEQRRASGEHLDHGRDEGIGREVEAGRCERAPRPGDRPHKHGGGARPPCRLPAQSRPGATTSASPRQADDRRDDGGASHALPRARATRRPAAAPSPRSSRRRSSRCAAPRRAPARRRIRAGRSPAPRPRRPAVSSPSARVRRRAQNRSEEHPGGEEARARRRAPVEASERRA